MNISDGKYVIFENKYSGTRVIENFGLDTRETN
jgi:hypothetical protein